MPCVNAKKWVAIAAITVTGAACQAQANPGALPMPDTALLTGDVRLACEAILCLSSGTRPSECTPSLKRYFSITHRKLSRTITARRNFLNLCPASRQDDNMHSLVNAMANGAGRCDAENLNATLSTNHGSDGTPSRRTSDAIPAHCNAYATHPYTDLSTYTAKYVGLPERGGLWVAPEQYEQALAAYTARVAAEDAAARIDPSGGS